MIIGVSGPISSGKSTLIRFLKDHINFLHIDLDRLGHDLLKDESILADVTHFFGDDILDQNGHINRAALGERVFSDQSELAVLNDIVHPELYQRVVGITAGQTDSIIILDGALLFDIGLSNMCDECIVVLPSSKLPKIPPTHPLYTRIRACQLKDSDYEQLGSICLKNDYSNKFFKQITTHVLPLFSSEASK